MTVPRQVLKGTSYLVSRRCSERRLFLRPCAETTAIFAYLLAVVAERYGILLHAFCVLSNHFHLVLTDPRAQLPLFHRDLDGLLARAINRSLGRWESFWDPDSYSAVRLENADSILEKMAYVLANPVAAGLVRHGRDWPGLWSGPALIGSEAVLVERPDKFFRKEGPLPALARLRLHRPPGFESDDSFIEALGCRLRDAEERAADDLAKQDRSFLGAARVLAQEPSSRPGSDEPRRALNPRVACRNKWKRIEALLRLAEFQSAYREALKAWRKGARDVLFPEGTWHMRVQHRVCCAASG